MAHMDKAVNVATNELMTIINAPKPEPACAPTQLTRKNNMPPMMLKKHRIYNKKGLSYQDNFDFLKPVFLRFKRRIKI
uniref:Uncharacterized protein n=1 Tax=Romanomermis culicivorax TaxID=13658 RepID=A0A915HQ15_ROMCU